MSLNNPFKILGLDQKTATEADVKAAYAKKLKVTRPEDDRDAFMALRDAFSAARSQAKHADRTRASQPAPKVEPDPDAINDTPAPKPKPKAKSKPKVKWTHDADLDWHVYNGPQGRLIKDTLRWMVKGGPNADSFTAKTAEALLTNPDISADEYRFAIMEYIVTKADTEGKANETEIWKTFDVSRPDWLTDDVIAALDDGVQIFKFKPVDTWAARFYNVALKLFEDAKGVTRAASQIDVVSMYAKEQTAFRGDDHGSYFDTDKMVWVEQSPVARAVTDFQDAVAGGMWDSAVRAKAILDRDEVQSLDEFQDLDRRLRQYVSDQTGYHSKDRKLVYPAWLSPSVLLMLDDMFGWSTHFGRDHWERDQFKWLHRVLSRDRDVTSNVAAFRAVAPAAAHAQARPVGSWLDVFRPVYDNPHWLVIGYLSYRALLVLVRMVS